MLHQQQMPGRRYRKVFGQAFDDAKRRSLDEIDVRHGWAKHGRLYRNDIHELLRRICGACGQDDAGVRFWRKGAREATKKGENSWRFAPSPQISIVRKLIPAESGVAASSRMPC